MVDIVDSSKCCGCEACVHICAHNAITLQSDNRGFLYPKVDKRKCVECGLCDDVCHFKTRDLEPFADSPLVYAVKNKNRNILLKSASGGAFSALAQWIFDKGGRVYGAAWGRDMIPLHIGINRIDDLIKLQGSKYVQSYIGGVYNQIKENLKRGDFVLFSGTPCQCAGLRSFLRKQYDNLFCVELICHGVPSAKFLRDYLDFLETEYGGKIIDLNFRDKHRDWGSLMSITYRKPNGKVKTIYLSQGESYYYYLFKGGYMCRPSCYNCKYANCIRQSDFTIGDYWGINKYHPEFCSNDGISVLIVNTEKGRKSLDEIEKYMEMVPSALSYVQEQNGQLNAPTKYNSDYDYIWDIYEEKGAKGIDYDYKVTHRKDIIEGYVKRKIPLWLKRYLRQFL